MNRHRLVALGATLAVALGGCGSEQGDDDDDFIAGGGPDAGTPSGGCALDDPPCVGETICIDNACVGAFNRIYRITVLDGSLPESDPNGECWDFGCGAPDPFVQLDLNGALLGVTAAVQDTFAPAWNMYVDAEIPAGSALTFWVWDEDVDEHDFAFGCALDPVSVEALRAGFISCEFPESTLYVAMEPR
jgi:hypothetical protein